MDILDRYNRVLIIPMPDYRLNEDGIVDTDTLKTIPHRAMSQADLIVARKIIGTGVTDEYYVLKNRYVTPKVGCNMWINREDMTELLKRHEYYSHNRT